MTCFQTLSASCSHSNLNRFWTKADRQLLKEMKFKSAPQFINLCYSIPLVLSPKAVQPFLLILSFPSPLLLSHLPVKSRVLEIKNKYNPRPRAIEGYGWVEMAKGRWGSFVNGILYILSKHRSEWSFCPRKCGCHRRRVPAGSEGLGASPLLQPQGVWNLIAKVDNSVNCSGFGVVR